MADYLTDENSLTELKNWGRKKARRWSVAVCWPVAVSPPGAGYSAQVRKCRGLRGVRVLPVGDGRCPHGTAQQARCRIRRHILWRLVLLHQAKEATDPGDLEGAIGMFRQIADAGAHPLIADIARVRLARLLQEQDDAEGALAVLAQVTSQGFRAQVLELKGDIHVLQGERALAHEAYVAAAAEIAEGNQRPILEFKVDDTAPPEES